MPNGRVKWFDPGRGTGVVEHNGREYAVDAEAMARDARTTGLPVHFDIERGPDGDIARNVVARRGSRTQKATGRVGDLVGAHHPSEKGQDEGDDLRRQRRDYGTQPRRLVEDWVTFLAHREIDEAVLLYAPNAQIQAGEQRVTGGSDIRRWLERSVLNGAREARAEVEGDSEDAFTVRWRTVPGDDRVALESVLQVEDGAIVHQETRETDQA